MIFSWSSLVLFIVAVSLCVLNVASGLLAPDFYARVMADEKGVVENVQVFFLTLALGLNLSMLWLMRGGEYPRRMRAWLIVIAAGLVFVLGEEISWGQHYVGWDAFGWFVHRNDQLETNLHNTSSWLDQKPRMLLVTALLVGGLIVPLLERSRQRVLLNLPEWFKPALENVPLAALVIIAQLPKQINGLKLPGVHFDVPNLRFSEMQELLIYIYFVAYLLTVFVKYLRSRPV